MREGLFPRLLEYAECMCSRDGFRFETEVRMLAPPNDLLPLIVQERLRQIRAIKTAMRRVTDFIYGAQPVT